KAEGPALASPGDQAVNEGTTLLTFTATATDPDLSSDVLKFSLDAGAPIGASIDPDTGVFSWTPADGPATTSVTIRVTDSTSSLSAAQTIAITVNAVPPTLTLSGASNATTGTPYTLNLSAIEHGASDTITGWTIQWGDGAIQTVSGSPPVVTHTYTAGP